MDGAINNPPLASMQLYERAGNQKHNVDGLDHHHSPMCEPTLRKVSDPGRSWERGWLLGDNVNN